MLTKEVVKNRKKKGHITVVDLFQEVGTALRKQGVTTREKALVLAESVKREI